jgi:transcriptional regulator with XRE-family HTH domain
MDNQKIGRFIAELRREKGMTQKELAEKLSVTDKAVSKWERGAGYPEVTVLPKLAALLGVTVSELLLGERDSHTETEKQTERFKPDSIVNGTIEYVEQSHAYNSLKIKRIALVSMTFAFLTAVFVCLLCNYAINRTFDWSLYVVGGTLTAWLVTAPLLTLKRHRVIAALSALTLTVVPLLMLIEYLCPAKNWVFPFGFSVALLSLSFLWISVPFFIYTRINRWYLGCYVLILFGVVANVTINTMTDRFLLEPAGDISAPIIAACCAFTAASFAIIGSIKKKAAKV